MMMIDASISKKQIALLIELLTGKPARPTDRAEAARRLTRELDSNGIAEDARQRILALTDYDAMRTAIMEAVHAGAGGIPEGSTALADAAKALDAGVEAAPVAEPAEPEAKPAKRRAKAEAKTVTVPAGLADKPRVRRGAVIREDGLEEGGPDAILVDAVRQPGGALHSDLCQLVGGWKKCDRRLARAAALIGVQLKATREGDDTRFEAA